MSKVIMAHYVPFFENNGNIKGYIVEAALDGITHGKDDIEHAIIAETSRAIAMISDFFSTIEDGKIKMLILIAFEGTAGVPSDNISKAIEIPD